MAPDPPLESPAIASVSTDALLQRANQADMGAVGALLERFDGYVEAQIRRQRTDTGMPPDRDLVRELVQEVRMRLVGRVQSRKPLIGGESGFRAYLRETAWHLWLDHLAARERVEIPFPTAGETIESGETSALNPLAIAADPRGDPLRQLEELEAASQLHESLTETVWQLVDDLDAAHPGRRYREIFEARIRAWQEEANGKPRLNQTEMARRLGCSQASVSMRLGEIWAGLRERWPREDGVPVGVGMH